MAGAQDDHRISVSGAPSPPRFSPSAPLLAGIAGYQLVPVAATTRSVPDDQRLGGTDRRLAEGDGDVGRDASSSSSETIPGIGEISATNSLGNTGIVLQFDLNRNIDAAAADVQAAISHATRQLPDNMTTPPSYRKIAGRRTRHAARRAERYDAAQPGSTKSQRTSSRHRSHLPGVAGSRYSGRRPMPCVSRSIRTSC